MKNIIKNICSYDFGTNVTSLDAKFKKEIPIETLAETAPVNHVAET